MADEDKKAMKKVKNPLSGSLKHNPEKHINMEPVIEKIKDFSSEMFTEEATYGDMMIFVLEDRMEEFLECYPGEEAEAMKLYRILDEAVSELSEARNPLTVTQRRQRAMVMRKYRTRIAQARKRAARRKASPEKLKARARRMALNVFRKRFTKDKPYDEMSSSEKIAVDRRLAKISPATVNRIAQRLLPKVRAAENARIASMNSGAKNESYESQIMDIATIDSELSEPKINLTVESDVYDILLTIESDGSVGGDEFIEAIDRADEVEDMYVISMTPSAAEFLLDLLIDTSFTDLEEDE